MSQIVISKSKIPASLIFIGICGKLINSPFVSGNYESELGKQINYGFDGIVLFAVLMGATGIYKRYLPIYIAALLSGITYVLSTIIYSDMSWVSALGNHLRIYLPLLVFPVLLKAYIDNPCWFVNKTTQLCVLIGLLLTIGLVFFPASMNRMEVWWPAYFGGLHTTAYVAFMFGVLGYSLSLHVRLKARYALSFVILIAIAIYTGWGVRTATIATIIFFLGIAISYIKSPKELWISLLIVAMPIAVITIAENFSFDELSSLSSGRLDMYVEKYHQLMKNTGLSWLIGNGAGSDLIETDVWLVEKGAHSDFITILVEGGIFHLMSLIIVLLLLYQKGGILYQSLLMSSIITSTVSNGIFVRPMAGYLLMIAMVLLFKNSRLLKNENVHSL